MYLLRWLWLYRRTRPSARSRASASSGAASPRAKRRLGQLDDPPKPPCAIASSSAIAHAPCWVREPVEQAPVRQRADSPERRQRLAPIEQPLEAGRAASRLVDQRAQHRESGRQPAVSRGRFPGASLFVGTPLPCPRTKPDWPLAMEKKFFEYIRRVLKFVVVL